MNSMMAVSHFLGIFYLIGLYSSVVCQETTYGRPIREARALAAPRAGCIGQYGPRCADCHTILTCANTLINSQPCSSINKNAPYCSNNACTSVAPTSCTLPFTCTSSGLFPDPSDCKRYHLCESAGGSSVTYECPIGFVYESKTGLCKRQRISSDCYTIDCTRTPNNYVIFPRDKSIMAYCQESGKETILFKCPDSVNMEFNESNLACNFVCKSEARYPDRLDCHKFYECFKYGNNYVSNYLSCPTGFWYDPTTKICTKLAAGTDCSSDIAPDEVAGSGGGALLDINIF